MLKNALLIAILAVLAGSCFYGALASIDRITERDCARGIKSACAYVK